MIIEREREREILMKWNEIAGINEWMNESIGKNI
jgi:hypothetical protein